MTDLLGMHRAVLRSVRSTSEKMVLLAIVDHYSEASPEPWPSVPTLAAHSSLGRTAVLDALAALERDGVIAIRRAHGRPNRYDLSRLATALARAEGSNRPPPTLRAEGDRGERAAEPVREADRSGEQPASACDVPPPATGDADVRDTSGGTTQTSNAPAPAAPFSKEAPVRQADWCGPDTRPPAGRDQSVCRTGVVRETDWRGVDTSPSAGRDQSARRTGVVRLADPKEPMKEPKKEATAVRARTRPDPNMPLVDRAQLALRDPRAAVQLRPQDWPEARQIAAAYSAASGSPRPLSELRRDSGLRAILELIAAGFAVDDITWVASSVPHEPWWRSGDRIRGLGSLSVEVASRALGEREAPPRPRVAKAHGSGVSDEARRIHRNTLLENAAAGWYGAEFRRAAGGGDGLRELADELERLEMSGNLVRTRMSQGVRS